MHLILAHVGYTCSHGLFKIVFEHHSAHAQACFQTPAFNCRGEVSEAAGRAFLDGERVRWVSQLRGP